MLPNERAIVPALLLILTLALCAGPALAAQAPAGDQEAAAKGGLAWLKLIDDGDYAASWGQAAPMFQKATTRDRWVKTLGAVREPLGKLTSRKLAKANMRHQLPGAPDGDYCMLLFDSVFAQKEEATELVTMQKMDDGSWRSVGYFIR